MNRRASCVGTFEVFEAAHVALRTLLAFSQPVNCIFWPIGMLNWLVAASKLHKHRETCCTAEWPFYSFLILWFWFAINSSGCARQLGPTMQLITYSFVLYLLHGRHDVKCKPSTGKAEESRAGSRTLIGRCILIYSGSAN